jgi:hypothetical protein
MTSHQPRDEEEGYCGNCHDRTRGETGQIGSGVVTQAQRDWGPDIYPDHYAREGCCGLPPGQHPLTPDEARERREWLDTEPGLTDRLERRRAQLARLEDLHAPEVLLAEQRRLVREIEEKLEHD